MDMTSWWKLKIETTKLSWSNNLTNEIYSDSARFALFDDDMRHSSK